MSPEMRLAAVAELRVDAGQVDGHRQASSAPQVESRTPRPRIRCVIGYVLAPRMRIGVPKETAAGEHRVALVPEVVSKLKAKGLDVVVQSGAGADALLTDAASRDAGAQIAGDAGRGVGQRRRRDDRAARPARRSAGSARARS